MRGSIASRRAFVRGITVASLHKAAIAFALNATLGLVLHGWRPDELPAETQLALAEMPTECNAYEHCPDNWGDCCPTPGPKGGMLDCCSQGLK